MPTTDRPPHPLRRERFFPRRFHAPLRELEADAGVVVGLLHPDNHPEPRKIDSFEPPAA